MQIYIKTSIQYLFKAQNRNRSTRYHQTNTNNEKEMEDLILKRALGKTPVRYLEYKIMNYTYPNDRYRGRL